MEKDDRVDSVVCMDSADASIEMSGTMRALLSARLRIRTQ